MKRWLKRIGLALLALAVLAVACGTIYEAQARAAARKAYPAPGRLVDVGAGRHIQIDCRGAGSPTVVFESGLDSFGSLSWSAVHDPVARTTRACAYSRAGLMWSDRDSRPFSSANLADDLHAALMAAGEKGPFVMVGHSLGGPYLLTYVARHGDEVAGLVFVDASHPEQIARMRAAIGKDFPQPKALAQAAGALSWTGAVRLATRSVPAPPSAPVILRGPATAWFPTSVAALSRELDGLDSTLAAAAGARRLGDRPLVVLTRGKKATPAELTQMKITAAQGDQLEAAWLKMHDEEAAWSTRGRNQVVPGASHYIQFDRPQVVIDAIAEVVGQVRLDRATAP